MNAYATAPLGVTGARAVRQTRRLSARERQVVGLAALGRTNKEIAYELRLAASTVRVLVVRAARKLGARGRADAVAYFSTQRVSAHASFVSPDCVDASRSAP
jgi:DNA-binding CsgD family transcriptional regulator